MAKARKQRSTSAPASPPMRWLQAEWAPIDEAFSRILKVNGSPFLTEGDLWRELSTPDRLASAVRLVARDGKEVEKGLIPDFWKRPSLCLVWTQGRVRVEGCPVFTVDGVPAARFFFIRRSDLDKFYPAEAAAPSAADDKPPPDSRADTPKLRPRETTHEWFSICGEIARRCHDRSGRVAVPNNESKLASDVALWCGKRYGKEPANSALREAVKRVCAALREVKI